MSSFFLSDNSGFKWEVGSASYGLFNLPIYEACKIKILTVISSSVSISAGGTQEFEYDSGTMSNDSGTFYPYLISGFDLTSDVGIYIQKAYVEAGSRLIKVRLANMASSSKSVTRLNIRVVYHMRYNNFISS